MASDFKMRAGETKTIVRLSDWMISIEHRLNVIDWSCHLIRADKCRNTQFISGAKKLEALVVFPNDSSQAGGWDWIPMTFGSICIIWNAAIEWLARGKSKWSFKGNRRNLEEIEVCHQERKCAWCGVLRGQGGCWWWWRRVEWNWGEQRQAKKRRRGLRSAYPAEQPIHANQRQKGREERSLELNRGASDRGRGGGWWAPILVEKSRQGRQYGALNHLSKRQCRLRSANRDWGAPLLAEKHHRGGGVWSSPPCVLDECSGFCSNTIYYCGRAKFTSIFILRTHNRYLLSSGILRKRKMNSCGQKH